MAPRAHFKGEPTALTVVCCSMISESQTQ